MHVFVVVSSLNVVLLTCVMARICALLKSQSVPSDVTNKAG
jgi:hypothetical protein